MAAACRAVLPAEAGSVPSFIIVRPPRLQAVLTTHTRRHVGTGRGTHVRDLRPVAPPLVSCPWRVKWVDLSAGQQLLVRSGVRAESE